MTVISVTESGIVIESKTEQQVNASSPVDLADFEIRTDLDPKHSKMSDCG